MISVVVTLPLVGDPDNFGGQAGSIDPVFLVLVIPSIVASLLALPWGDWRSGDARPRFLVLAAVAAVPAAWYGVDQALMQRNTFPPTADPHHNAHWWVMAAFAFMVVLVTAAAALPGRGRRLGAFLAGASSFAVGVGSVLEESAASAVSIGWALAAMLWGRRHRLARGAKSDGAVNPLTTTLTATIPSTAKPFWPKPERYIRQPSISPFPTPTTQQGPSRNVQSWIAASDCSDDASQRWIKLAARFAAPTPR